jgi:hypothetical protein
MVLIEWGEKFRELMPRRPDRDHFERQRRAKSDVDITNTSGERTKPDGALFL